MASVTTFVVGAVIGYVLAKPELLDKLRGKKEDDSKK